MATGRRLERGWLCLRRKQLDALERTSQEKPRSWSSDPCSRWLTRWHWAGHAPSWLPLSSLKIRSKVSWFLNFKVLSLPQPPKLCHTSLLGNTFLSYNTNPKVRKVKQEQRQLGPETCSAGLIIKMFKEKITNCGLWDSFEQWDTLDAV